MCVGQRQKWGLSNFWAGFQMGQCIMTIHKRHCQNFLFLQTKRLLTPTGNIQPTREWKRTTIQQIIPKKQQKSWLKLSPKQVLPQKERRDRDTMKAIRAYFLAYASVKITAHEVWNCQQVSLDDIRYHWMHNTSGWKHITTEEICSKIDPWQNF